MTEYILYKNNGTPLRLYYFELSGWTNRKSDATVYTERSDAQFAANKLQHKCDFPIWIEEKIV